jgi:hypothetical protein
MLSLCSPALAHRLEADYRVLPGRKVQVESWFDLTGDSPVGAKVTVYRGDDILVEGKLNDKGIFLFSYTHLQPLRVVVSASAGHRKELSILAADLVDSPASPAPKLAAEPASHGEPVPLVDRGMRVTIKDVLLGIGLLLGAAAFALGLGNARKLRELNRKLHDPEG